MGHKKDHHVTEDVMKHHAGVKDAINKAYAEHDMEAKKHGMHPKGSSHIESLKPSEPMKGGTKTLTPTEHSKP